MLTRRQFVKAALAAGAASAVPPILEGFLQSARATVTSPTSGFFLTEQQWKTCAALCSRIVPTGSDSSTDPGATEARAVLFIDRFLSAFDPNPTVQAELAAVANGQPIWIHGNYSGRNPLPDSTGSTDDFLTNGVAQFLGMTPAQTMSWRYQLYGPTAFQGAPAWASSTWQGQVGTTIPTPTPPAGLRAAYVAGLAAFDSWSESMFQTPYSGASTEEQDLMLQLAGNVVLNAVTGNVPLPFPSPPAPPPAASALFPIITLHTFQATYGLPGYSWRTDTAEWDALGYDGDTQPLGNSIYNEQLTGWGEGSNAGYGDGVYRLRGDYTQRRPVSDLAPGATPLSAAEAAAIKNAITRNGGR